MLGKGVTAAIMLQGYNVYGSHTGYMTLLSSIELTPETLALVIDALPVSDIVARVCAFKR